VNAPTVLLLLAAVVGLVWTLCLVPPREGPGRSSLIVLLYATTWWSACILCEALRLRPDIRILCDHLPYFGLGLTPCCFCFLLWDATFLGRPTVPRAWWAAAFGFATFTLWAALANPGQWVDRRIEASPGNLNPPHYISGPLYYAIIAAIYLMLFGAIGFTAARQRGRSSRRRRIYAGIVIALGAPMVVGVLDLLFELDYEIGDVTPFAFLVTAPVLAWLLTRNGLCDPLPIARSALLDILPDAILVVNADGNVAEANEAARDLPGVTAKPTGIALHAMGFWASPLAAALAKPGETLAFATPEPASRHYELLSTRLAEDGALAGHLLVLRDVTVRQNAEIRLRTALGDLGSQLAENQRLQNELHRQARRDPLTNLHNRRSLDETLPALLEESGREQRPLSLAMIDIDYFKRINDEFGHRFGDETLKIFSAFMAAMARPGDLVFRLGGEEFLAVLADTTPPEAGEILQAWLAACRQGLCVEGRDLALSFSAGIAGTSQWERDPATLLAQADAAAYRAKRQGRGLVVLHGAAAADAAV
jgi:diguanylate cyclase (GGDEF)-like protein